MPKAILLTSLLYHLELVSLLRELLLVIFVVSVGLNHLLIMFQLLHCFGRPRDFIVNVLLLIILRLTYQDEH